MGWTLALLWLAGCRGPAEAPAAAPADGPPLRVVLVVLDAARPDRFGCYGYERDTTPNLDALAAGGVIYRQHRTTATATRGAVPSLLWSRHFVPPLLPISAQIPLHDTTDLHRGADDPWGSHASLARAFRVHRSAAISAHPWICWGNEGLHEFTRVIPVQPDPATGTALPYADAGAVVDAAIAWLDEEPERDALLYLHLMDTHFPHAMGPEARAFLGEGAPTPLPDPLDERTLRQRGEPLDAAERAQLDALVDGGLARADRELGRLFDHLGAPRDRALIVVTADHGEHLLEVPGRVGHDGPWYEAVARVPLIVSYPPGLSPGVVDEPTSAVDVGPTMAALLAPDSARLVRGDGRDVAPGAGGAAPPPVSPAGVIVGEDKCLFHDPPAVVLDPEILASELRGERYDLATDPWEQTDRWAEDPEAVARCVQAYREALQEPYQRYTDLGRSQPLRMPVALAVDALGLVPAAPTTALDPEQAVAAALDPGWRVVTTDRHAVLACGGGDRPVELQADVPPGRYRVSLGALGAARVALAGADAVAVELRPVVPDRPTPGYVDEASLGLVEVEDHGLALRLRPDPDGRPFVLRHVRLEPVGERAAPVAPIPAGMDEQLRALGYVE